MKQLFIPNWNGHLYLQEGEDTSVTSLFKFSDYKNKKLINIVKNDIDFTNHIIETEFAESFDVQRSDCKKVLSITGDHSNTFPLVKSFAKKVKPDFKLVIFDAHPDVEVSTDVISHEDYLRNLIDKNIVKPENVYLFGIRTFSRTEFEYLISKKVNFWTITDILENLDEIKNILQNLSGQIYTSIDIDVLDPDFAPGTYFKEWCGLSLDELCSFLEILRDKSLAFDICEYFAEKDENDVTFKSVTKLIQSLNTKNL